MIISNDNKIVLCTPTKVGSTSLEKTILDDYKVGRRLYGDEATGRGRKQTRGNKHGSICTLNVKHRVILVRHPLARFASIYAFLGNSKGNFFNSLVKYARKDDVINFCKCYLDDKRGRTVWTKQLSSYVKEFKPERVYKLEENGIAGIAKLMGVKLDEVPHINKTVHGGWEKIQEKLPRPLRNEIVKLHKESIEVLRYGK